MVRASRLQSCRPEARTTMGAWSAMIFPYQEIFEGVETTLIEAGSRILPIETIRQKLEPFKHVEGKTLTDAEYWWILTTVIFYSGFRAETVDAHLDTIRQDFSDYSSTAAYGQDKVNQILADPKMIRNSRKVQACVKNAQTFRDIISQHGGFQHYISSLAPGDSFENLMLFKEELEYRFDGIGRITTYHIMTEIGLPVLKPDRVIGRVFERLGLIESEKQLLKAVIQGRKFAQATGHPIRYIDIVFVAFGQMELSWLGIERGICLERYPSCAICKVKNHCKYYAQNMAT